MNDTNINFIKTKTLVYFKTTKTLRLYVKNKLILLLTTMLGLLTYDVLFGLNLQKYLFLNLIQNIELHIKNKIRKYIKEIGSILILFALKKLNQLIFKLKYLINQTNLIDLLHFANINLIVKVY